MQCLAIKDACMANCGWDPQALEFVWGGRGSSKPPCQLLVSQWRLGVAKKKDPHHSQGAPRATTGTQKGYIKATRRKYMYQCDVDSCGGHAPALARKKGGACWNENLDLE